MDSPLLSAHCGDNIQPFPKKTGLPLLKEASASYGIATAFILVAIARSHSARSKKYGPVTPRIHENRHQPGFGIATGAKLVQGPKRFEASLLHEILGVRRHSHQATSQA
jgi:hypothetical protein